VRRKDQEITSRRAIEAILKRATVCRIALSVNDSPYIIPMNHGYAGDCLYFHSSAEGKKIEILKQNNRVCFEVDLDHEIVPAAKACKWSLKYRSVIGFGRSSFVDDLEEKRRALDAIMSHHSNERFQYSEKDLRAVTVIKVQIDSMTGKQSGFQTGPRSSGGTPDSSDQDGRRPPQMNPNPGEKT